jgi:glycosyltransferase involved in cell wall biosynthesis
MDTTLFMRPPGGGMLPDLGQVQRDYGLERPPTIRWTRDDPNRWVARARTLSDSIRAGREFPYAYTTRELAALGALLGGAKHVILEIHQPPAFWPQVDRISLKLAHRNRRLHVVCISRRLAETVAEQMGLDVSQIIVEHSGHNLPIRSDYELSSAAGRRLRAMYVGSFIQGKGVEMLFELAEAHPGIDFIAVGGSAPGRALPPNLTVRGPVAHTAVADLLGEADVLLMPITTRERFASPSGKLGKADEEYYSPLKMVEYLSAGRSIIASNLPSIAEVLVDGSNCLLVDPDSTAAWSLALERLAGDAGLRVALAREAAHTAERHTTAARVRRLLEAIEGAE